MADDDVMDPRAFVAGLTLEEPLYRFRNETFLRGGGGASAAATRQAAVDMGAVISFVDNLTVQERDDVLDSVQLAQRAAGGEFDRFAETEGWYRRFSQVLQGVGWIVYQDAFVKYDQSSGELKIDKHALQMLASVASANALGVLTQALGALEKMADDSGEIALFTRNSVAGRSGNLQLGAVERGESGVLNLAMGAYYFRSTDKRQKVVFAGWGAEEIELWSSVQKMTLNPDRYALARDAVRAKLGNPADFIAGLKLSF